MKKENKDAKINKIHLCNKEDLVFYIGLDVVTAYYLCKLSDDELLDISDKFRWCYNFLHEGHNVFANMTWNGISVSPKDLEDLDEELEETEEDLIKRIKKLPDVQEFMEWLEEHNEKKEEAKRKVAKEKKIMKAEQKKKERDAKITGRRIEI